MKTRPLILAGLAVVAIALLVADRTIWTRVRVRGKPIWRAAVAADSMPVTVAQAEEQGARFPRSTEPENYAPVYTADAYVGTAERRCVDADTASYVRSGDFIGGSFSLYAEYWSPEYGKLWFSTGRRWPLKTPVQFRLTATRIDTTGYAFVYASRYKMIRWRDPYFDAGNMGMNTGMILPTRGKWMLIATMHQNWGCVLFTL